MGSFKIIEKFSNSIYRVKTGQRKTELNLFHDIKLLPMPVFKPKDKANET